jgi:hypothetical protein
VEVGKSSRNSCSPCGKRRWLLVAAARTVRRSSGAAQTAGGATFWGDGGELLCCCCLSDRQRLPTKGDVRRRYLRGGPRVRRPRCRHPLESATKGYGCHIKTKFGGQLLTAVGIDPNDCIFPIAMAVVEVESMKTWTWFLQSLKQDLK